MHRYAYKKLKMYNYFSLIVLTNGGKYDIMSTEWSGQVDGCPNKPLEKIGSVA